ncbi:MAG TPA: hypothetical protein VF647_04210 [Longimicrobium sp.]|jgi:hypothetical protein
MLHRLLLVEIGRATTTFAAACGYRPIGEAHHHSVFKAAVALTGEDVREAFTAINGLRGTRHDTNCGSAEVVDGRTWPSFGLRELRPSAKARIRVTKPRKAGRTDATG